MGENKQVRNSMHGSIVPVRKGNGTNKHWYTIPYLSKQNVHSFDSWVYSASPWVAHESPMSRPWVVHGSSWACNAGPGVANG